jgi:hypothetical protein
MNLTCPVTVLRTMEGYRHVKTRQKCGQPAELYRVCGASYSCYQVLCPLHAARAVKLDKFKLSPVAVKEGEHV